MAPIIVGAVALFCLFLGAFRVFALTALAFLIYFYPIAMAAVGVMGLTTYLHVKK